MGKFLLKWVFLALSILAAAAICKALGLGFEAKADNAGEFLRLMLGTAVLALLNSTLGRVLKFLTIPLSCLTLGLFTFVVNAVILVAAASLELGFKFTVEGSPRFLAALVASLLISAVSGILGSILPDRERRDDQ